MALDIDGTLLPPSAPLDALPSAEIVAAIKALEARGVHIVLASGRMYPGTARIAAALGNTSPAICQQGCSVHLAAGQITHEFPLDRGLALELVAYAREIGHTFEWFNPWRYLVSRESVEARIYAARSGVETEWNAHPEDAGIEPTGIGIISSPDEAPHIHRELAGRYGERLHVLDFAGVTVAVSPDANKGHALSLVCTDLGIDRRDVAAVGDSVNDAAMLAWAGRGVAMAHSDQYALDAADEVLVPYPDEREALVRFLRELGAGR